MRRNGVGVRGVNWRQEVVDHRERGDSLAEKYFSSLSPFHRQLSFFSPRSGDYLFLFLVALICQRHFLAVTPSYCGPSIAFDSAAGIGYWDVTEIGYALLAFLLAAFELLVVVVLSAVVDVGYCFSR